MISAKMDPKDGSQFIPGTGLGFPKGRIIEIYGPEAAAKTTLALMLAARTQAEGGTVAFLDVEHALSEENARRIGVRTSEWLYSEPETAEQALKAMQKLVEAGISLVVLDSVAALLPTNEAEGEMGKSVPGAQARLMGQACRKLVGLAAKHGTIVLFINQLRQKIGIMFGNPETTSGGNALKFYASVRIDVRKVLTLKKEGRVVGVRVLAKTVKNKIAPPFRDATFDVRFGKGISIPKKKQVEADKAARRSKWGKKAVKPAQKEEDDGDA